MGKMPTTSLSKAYNYHLLVVYLNTRLPLQTLALLQNGSCVIYLKDIIFERSLLCICLKKVTFFEKKSFSLLVTPILLVSSPLLPITLTLDCKQYTEILVFSMFQREQRSTISLFQKQEQKVKKRNIENLAQIHYIGLQYSDQYSQ